MRTRLKHHAAGLLLAAGALLALGASTGVNAQDVTLPEQLLFLNKHFSKTDDRKLEYAYRQELADPDTFTDSVTVDVQQHHDDGTVTVETHFLSGAREIHVPRFEQASGNPAILGFLERDIAEMRRVTGGSSGYFRKQIRMALAHPKLRVNDIDITYNNKAVRAQQIVIQPYLNDPMKDEIGKYVKKRYVFVLSDSVPGSVYRVYTELPDDVSGVVADTSMTLVN